MVTQTVAENDRFAPGIPTPKSDIYKEVYSIYSFTKFMKEKLYKVYFDFCNENRKKVQQSDQGKLNMVIPIFTLFCFEKYLYLKHVKDFRLRQSICKINICAHPSMIETDRYAK